MKRKWIEIGITGLIIFLIAFTKVGYIENAIVNTTHKWVWWMIFGIVCVKREIIELVERGK